MMMMINYYPNDNEVYEALRESELLAGPFLFFEYKKKMTINDVNQYVRKIETVKCQMKKNQHAFENSTRCVKFFCNNYI